MCTIKQGYWWHIRRFCRQRRRRTPRRSNLWVRVWMDKGRRFDAWSLTGNIGSYLTCDMRTLLVISTTSECKQNAVSAVRAPCNSMYAVEAPWECNEGASNRQLERRWNVMELRRNAKVAMRSPLKRLENTATSSGKQIRFPCDLTAIWEI